MATYKQTCRLKSVDWEHNGSTGWERGSLSISSPQLGSFETFVKPHTLINYRSPGSLDWNWLSNWTRGANFNLHQETMLFSLADIVCVLLTFIRRRTNKWTRGDVSSQAYYSSKIVISLSTIEKWEGASVQDLRAVSLLPAVIFASAWGIWPSTLQSHLWSLNKRLAHPSNLFILITCGLWTTHKNQ